GYGCEDHFFELDTLNHCWQTIDSLLGDDTTHGILCDVGMPMLHAGVRYNCRVFLCDGKILGIRPKLFLADDGNYRESRWFTAWTQPNVVERTQLPPAIAARTGQVSVPFGVFILQAPDGVTYTAETC
ncbi:hypothetical protein EON62_01490, partial [archaeon]